MHKLGRVALWVCQAALALMFLAAGGAKFGSPMWPRMFERWGYPDHFYLIVGAVEVAAGLALLVPRLASPASLVLIVIMIGAGATHAMHGEQQRLRLRRSSGDRCRESTDYTDPTLSRATDNTDKHGPICEMASRLMPRITGTTRNCL